MHRLSNQINTIPQPPNGKPILGHHALPFIAEADSQQDAIGREVDRLQLPPIM
ncbi:hypothetical protein [Nocardia terpenica]|uniref:Uncharacterized protein n=1 Tax=Nocardia terpenica TaxID=455432 RepID=A0A6G9Z9L8_9NOCA|nr:hypothetical protein [Nocardia terpenica]QIS22091.1 hypothetical protein F6W96_30830 [Nocardia terpenica]